jgi:hypothetical protein
MPVACGFDTLLTWFRQAQPGAFGATQPPFGGLYNMLDQIKPNLLTEHIGTTFEVINDPASVFGLTLTSVVEHEKTERNHSFSLLFHGPQTPFIPQAIYKLQHAELGVLEIFLVPVAKDKDGFQYEAVFNQML